MQNKYIVEFGYPQNSCDKHPCGVSGSIQFASKKDAISAANNIIFVMSKGKKYTSNIAWNIGKGCPRQVYWANDRSYWCSISVLDGVMRGAYAGVANREAMKVDA